MSRRDFTIGHAKRNLVLKTAGTVRVLIGDKYYTLGLQDDPSYEEESEISEDIESSEDILSSDDDLIITNTINGYKYPGEGKVIMTLDGGIYYTKNGKYETYIKGITIPTSFSKTINFNNDNPFNVYSSNLIENLNANYLEGHVASDFIKNKSEVNLRNVVFDSISSSDGVFEYKDGKWSLNKTCPELNFIKNKVYINKGFNIIKSQELEYSRGLPYENTLLQDLLNVIDCFPENPYYYINSCLSCDIDLSALSSLSVIDQLSYFNKMKDILFYAKDDSTWDYNVICDDKYISLQDLRKDVVDISKLRFHKSSFVLDVDRTDGLNIYDEFVININSYFKTDLNGNRYNLCDNVDFCYLSNDVNIANCIITKIDRKNNRISITTDFETTMYKNVTIDTDVITVVGSDKQYSLYYFNNDCGVFDDITDEFAISDGSIIGNLSKEMYFGESLSGYGIYIKNNGYISNSKIDNTNCIQMNISDSNIVECVGSNLEIGSSDILNSNIIDCNLKNSFEYLQINGPTELNVDFNKSYSINNNGGSLELPSSNNNGVTINIYSLNAVDVLCNNFTYRLNPGEYSTFINIPVSGFTYEWIKINKNV